MSVRARPVLLLVAVSAFVAIALAFAPSARATNFIWRFTACDEPDGSTCLNGGGGLNSVNLPIGTAMTLKIIPGAIGGCDGSGGTASTVDWGDGTTPTYGTGTAYHSHTYQGAGTFVITASCGGYTNSFDNPPLTIGGGGIGGVGGLGPLDPSGALFAPTLTGLILALVALGMANARPPLPNVPAGTAGRPAWWRPRLQSGIPASMAQHVVSLRDIPLGAPRQEQPRIQMEPGKPTDPFQKMHCPACGGIMGYAVAGWFCMNPACPLRHGPQTQFPGIGQGYGPPPLAPPTV
ncbi:MAG: hypothetical protein E6K18_07285 [Methanobacteriota archaeon]|nr:MAG: hypothetical protein E6K18_07285 [Euryarchaeota archaeon]